MRYACEFFGALVYAQILPVFCTWANVSLRHLWQGHQAAKLAQNPDKRI